MAELDADWSADSNQVIHISLVAPAAEGIKAIHTFNPKMSYSIFGDEERIFGYQGLKINLRYNACDMRPGLQIMYSKKFKTVGETSPTDLKAVLEPYLPKTAFEKSNVFEAAIRDTSYADYKPPGELWKTIQAGGQTFEVWKSSLADMAVQQMVKRIQILVPFFIEGGTFIDLHDPDSELERWTVFFLYQKKVIDVAPEASPYTFMGYSTVYRYFYYQSPTPPSSPPVKKQRIQPVGTLDFTLPVPEITFHSLPCRSRISQFVILPPFQGGGNGSRFYNAIFDFYLQEPETMEITVEDPNEAFDDLRDLNDLARLRTLPEFTALRVNTKVTPRSKGLLPRDILDSTILERLRKKIKIAPRQFARVTEMQLLSLIPTGIRQSLINERPSLKGEELKAKEHEYHLWKLWTKKRLYKHNRDMLMQLDRSERVEKLDEALGSVEADYARLLVAAEQRVGGKTLQGNGIGSSSNGAAKRPSPDDKAESAEEPSAKRVKLVE